MPCDVSRVARLGGMAPIGLLLTAVGALKFGFGALIATFWAFSNHWKLLWNGN